MKSLKLAVLFVLLGVVALWAGATFSRVKTWNNGDTLTASDLNAEFNNILNELDPGGVDDYSATATAMQSTSDPYPGGAASLATSLQGELERMRYQILQLKTSIQQSSATYWYEDVPATGHIEPTNIDSISTITFAVAGGTITNVGAIHFMDGSTMTSVSQWSQVAFSSANGHGSTATKIRRWAFPALISSGTAITCSDSAVLGTTCTVHEDGVYSGFYGDQFTDGANAFGVTMNSQQLTTNIQLTTATTILTGAYTPGANLSNMVYWKRWLPAGTIIRAHDQGAASGTAVFGEKFSIQKDSN